MKLNDSRISRAFFNFICLSVLAGYYSVVLADPVSAIDDIRISNGADDVEERSGNVSVGSSDLELVRDGTVNQIVGLRFNTLSVPRGALITQAYLQFHVDEVDTDPASLLFQAEDTDNAPPFLQTSSNLSARNRTSSSISWTPPPWDTVHAAGPDQRTPDISPVIQEVISRTGWNSGNSIAIIVTGSGKRTAESYNGESQSAPILHIEFDVEDALPGVSIYDPLSNTTYNVGQQLSFGATADDVEDGDLTPIITWASSIDGIIGSGGEITTGLSAGIHTITANVLDSAGQSGSESVTVTLFAQTGVLIGAGDIAGCGSQYDEETADLLDSVAGTVFTLGDGVYPNGSLAEYVGCYEPTWGRHKARTRPSSGNHDYNTTNASGYYSYFGSAAGSPPGGYYSYDIENWHIVVLNSECDEVGGCDLSSAQGQWLQADLAANTSACTLAYWHRPRFTSHGTNGLKFYDFWQLLYAAGAEVILNGHTHAYERFGEQSPDGLAQPGPGIRQFIVGTGGSSLANFATPVGNSEVQHTDSYGVLKLTLNPGSYDWEFVPIAGSTFTDSGSESCTTSGNNSPVVSISVPASDSEVMEGDSISFIATANDVEDGDLSASLSWTSSRDGFIGSGETFNYASLSVGNHTIVTSSMDSGGLVGSDSIGITVTPVGNTPPSVSIDLPVDGAINNEFDLISFNASASDAEDGDLGAELIWYSDLDGEFGLGSSFDYSALSIGTHLITASVADSGGLSSSDALYIEVQNGDFVDLIYRIASPEDDAEQRLNGTVSLNSSDLELAFDKTKEQIIGLRFNAVLVPQGAGITDAYIQFQTDETSSGASVLTVRAEAADNGSIIENTANNITSRSMTDASVSWQPPAWDIVGAAGPEQRTPGLGSIVQEIVNRPGWSAGSSLVFVISGSGSRTADAFEGNSQGAPMLSIQYSTNNLPPHVDAGADQSITISDTVVLSGTALDDGLPTPPGAISVNWSQISGPGIATFGSAQFETSEASFTEVGLYTVRLTASDSQFEHYDEVAITVNPTNGNNPPVVDAGPDLIVSIVAGADLAGMITDDSLPNPPGTTTELWIQIDGPGSATFLNPNDPLTHVDFSAPGNYTLELVGDDSELESKDQVSISVAIPGGSSTIDVQITDGLDDAEERGSGVTRLTSSDLELVDDNSNQTVGLRFSGIGIPNGSTIVNAHVQFQTDEVSVDAASLTIQGEYSPDANQFDATSHNISARPVTSASINWTPAPWAVKNSAGAEQRTADISAVIQEIITQPLWDSGNALSLIITGSGVRVAEAFEGSSTGAPVLHIEFEANL